jgi:copper chaperone CopZ
MNLNRCIAVTSFLFASVVAFAGEKVEVTGMTCGGCAQAIRAQLEKFPEVASVEIDVKKGMVAVEFKESKSLSRAQIIEAIEKKGFKAKKKEGA